jgi:hypothetical protein
VDTDPSLNIYIAAAIQKKHVKVTITTDRSVADFVLEGVSDHRKRLGLKSSILSNLTAPVYPQFVSDYDGASVRLVNKSKDGIFAYSVDRNNTLRGRQTAAESIAKHLKHAILTQPQPGLILPPSAVPAPNPGSFPPGPAALQPKPESIPLGPAEPFFAVKSHPSLWERIAAFPSSPNP